MDFEELEEDGRRYILVPSMSDAFRTNVEFSDVEEVEDARTSEAMRLTLESSVGLYRRFQYNGRKVSARLQATYHDVDVPRNTVHTTSPLSQAEQLLHCGALCDTWHHVRLTLFACNEH